MLVGKTKEGFYIGDEVAVPLPGEAAKTLHLLFPAADTATPAAAFLGHISLQKILEVVDPIYHHFFIPNGVHLIGDPPDEGVPEFGIFDQLHDQYSGHNVKRPDVTFDEVIARRLKVMDQTAFTLCRENNLALIVFDMDTVGNLEKVVAGENIGTIVTL